MDKSLRNKLNYYSRKLQSINYLGGKCKKCGEKDQSKLCFHHVFSDSKNERVSWYFYSSWEKLKVELDKCELLCFNCHIEKHYEIIEPKNKRFLLEIKGVNCCEQCGYSKCIACLDFHHPNNDKNFEICDVHVKINNINLLKEKLESELNKCVVLCKNCHQHIHSDVEFFEDHKEEILNKTWLKKKSKIDRNEVLKLYKEGYKQIDIVKHFNSNKGTIGGIFMGFRKKGLI